MRALSVDYQYGGALERIDSSTSWKFFGLCIRPRAELTHPRDEGAGPVGL
jgi:hypothetical protein